MLRSDLGRYLKPLAVVRPSSTGTKRPDDPSGFGGFLIRSRRAGEHRKRSPLLDYHQSQLTEVLEDGDLRRCVQRPDGRRYIVHRATGSPGCKCGDLVLEWLGK